MTRFLAAVVLLVVVHASGAQPTTAARPSPGVQQAKIRTFLDCKGLPRERLRSSVSAKFYKQLTISPLDAWIVARAPLHDMKSGKAKILRSEAGGIYDGVALTLAEEMGVAGLDRTESRIPMSHIDVHVLIYRIRDAIMAVGFWHVPDSRYADYRQIGRAWIGFYQNGKWTFLDNRQRR